MKRIAPPTPGGVGDRDGDESAFGWLDPALVTRYVLRWLVADRCGWDARIVDVCCGPGLQLPFLYQRGHKLRSYTGLDLCPQALQRARARLQALEAQHQSGPFAPGTVEWVQQDVALPWPKRPPYDLAIYTRALEYLPAASAEASLRHAADALKASGLLMLSASQTPAQHRDGNQQSTTGLEELLTCAGFDIEARIGLLPGDDLPAMLTDLYGPAAVAWYRDLHALAPPPLIEAVTAVAVPEGASEVLYQCRKR